MLRLFIPAIALALAILPAPAADTKPIEAFNGKDLKGWRGYKKTDASGTRWKIENGWLTLPPSTGEDTKGARDIISKDTFDQFDLIGDRRQFQTVNQRSCIQVTDNPNFYLLAQFKYFCFACQSFSNSR